MVGLGYTKDRKALASLKRMVSEDYWRRYSLESFGQEGPQPETHGNYLMSLRECALRGIASAGTTEALNILVGLRRGPCKDLTHKIKAWEKICKRRIKASPQDPNIVS